MRGRFLLPPHPILDPLELAVVLSSFNANNMTNVIALHHLKSFHARFSNYNSFLSVCLTTYVFKTTGWIFDKLYIQVEVIPSMCEVILEIRLVHGVLPIE